MPDGVSTYHNFRTHPCRAITVATGGKARRPAPAGRVAIATESRPATEPRARHVVVRDNLVLAGAARMRRRNKLAVIELSFSAVLVVVLLLFASLLFGATLA